MLGSWILDLDTQSCTVPRGVVKITPTAGGREHSAARNPNPWGSRILSVVEPS